MTDTVNKETRSRIMARVRNKDTIPELRLRKALFARGLRYRLHRRDLPGKPDLVFPSRKAVIFVHGCQWHWHGCPRCRMPATNTAYWETKISSNQARDRKNVAALRAKGWRVLIVWECALKARTLDSTVDEAACWLHGSAALRIIEPPAISETASRNIRRPYRSNPASC